MWLINTSTRLLKHFEGKAIPRYAILSHTWSKDEVTFKEIGFTSSQSKNGYRKIAMTCQLASQYGLQYAWVDTCCIDKSSSAELSEAINSMFRWYERSEVCVVYLEDLPVEGHLDVHLQHCRWFTRGWTLQELIAPNRVHFYDQNWNFRGSKQDLIERLTEITRIDRAVLQKHQSLSSIAVARKLSWAAHRQTTRVEDTAYCLLGLFDIKMPLLYGEEEKAFRRLQIEIINTTPDLSIFAWKLPFTPGIIRLQSRRVYSGLLAESPRPFSESLYNPVPFTSPRRDFVVTNIGVKTRIQIVCEEIQGKAGYRYILPLDCCGSSGKPFGVRLRKCGPDHFVREDPFDLLEREGFLFSNAPHERYLLTTLPGKLASTYLSENVDCTSDFSIAESRSHVLQIRLPELTWFYNAWPQSRYDAEDRLFFVQGDTEWDSATFRIEKSFVFEWNDQHNVTANLECTFFALGWSDIEGKALQCSIVKSSPSATALSEIYHQLVEWDPDRAQVIDTLIHHKIPRSSAVAIEIPGTGCSGLISFALELVSDRDICANDFWSLELYCDIHKTEALPTISHGEWVRDD